MGWIVYPIIAIINGLIFGFITQHVAETKGYDTGFAWGFWLGLIGLLVVGFRPNITGYETTNYEPLYGNTSQAAQGSWICSCGTSNPNALNYCLRCRRTRDEVTYQPKIACSHCGAQNRSTNTTCFACGKPLNQASGESAASAVTQEIEVLTQLSKLHDQGILTDEEFQKKKEQILSQPTHTPTPTNPVWICTLCGNPVNSKQEHCPKCYRKNPYYQP